MNTEQYQRHLERAILEAQQALRGGDQSDLHPPVSERRAMSTDTPTPRTDALMESFTSGMEGCDIIEAYREHARALEVELANAKQQILMDTARIEEMQKAGHALEADAATIAELQRALACYQK